MRPAAMRRPEPQQAAALRYLTVILSGFTRWPPHQNILDGRCGIDNGPVYAGAGQFCTGRDEGGLFGVHLHTGCFERVRQAKEAALAAGWLPLSPADTLAAAAVARAAARAQHVVWDAPGQAAGVIAATAAALAAPARRGDALPSDDDDIRDCYLRVLTAGQRDAYWPVRDLMTAYQAGKFTATPSPRPSERD